MEGILEKAKVAFKENKVEVIMGVCIVIPMLLVSLIFSGVDSILYNRKVTQTNKLNTIYIKHNK